MNDTLEGGPWAPILVGGYFTGAAVTREYTVYHTQYMNSTKQILRKVLARFFIIFDLLN